MSTATRSANAERFAARVRRRRRRMVLRTVMSLLVVAGVGALAWLVWWSSVLSVHNVTVAGAEGDLAADIEEVAEVPLGVPLMRVNTGEVADRVGELPEVGEVEIQRSWPQTLTIEVQPRTPMAAVPDGGRWWSVDEHGVLFNRADKAPKGLPVLNAPTWASARLARATGVAVMSALPASVEKLVKSVQVESAADVRLILKDDVTVLWGTADRSDDKARVLLALMKRQEEPPSSYNVSAPDRPAVVP